MLLPAAFELEGFCEGHIPCLSVILTKVEVALGEDDFACGPIGDWLHEKCLIKGGNPCAMHSCLMEQVI